MKEEEQAGAGGGSSGRLVVVEGQAHQRHLPVVLPVLVCSEGTLDGHDISAVCRLASRCTGEDGGKKAGSGVERRRRRELRRQCRRYAYRPGRIEYLNTSRKGSLGLG